MGILSSFLSTGSKVTLAREWAKERARRDLGQVAEEFVPLVDALPTFRVMGLPEYSIITIVETYAELSKKKVLPGEILARIEAHRSSTTGRVRLPERAELEVYVFDRMNIEHRDAQLDREWTDLLVDRCRARFGLEPKPDLSWMDAPMITRTTPKSPAQGINYREQHAAMVGIIRRYADGLLEESEFLELIWPFIKLD